MDTDPTPEPASAPEAAAPQLRRDLRDRAPRSLSVAVIVWMDDREVEPTVITHRSPVVVARAAALAIHEMITAPYAYGGATEFLESQKPPQGWRTPEDVDAWLDALRNTTSYPAFSFHRVSVTGDTNGPSGLSVDRHLQQALQERERALQPGDPAGFSDEEPRRPGDRAMTPQHAAESRPGAAGILFLGVVVWSDDPEVEPSVFVGTDQVTVMLATALGIHEMLDRSPAYDGAADFLAAQPAPATWKSVSDVHDWLDALREATPYPVCSLQQIPARALDDVPRGSFERSLLDALRAREHAVTDVDDDPTRSALAPREGLGR